MKNSVKLIALLVAAFAFVTINMAMTQKEIQSQKAQDKKPAKGWDIPAKFKSMKNPLKPEDPSINSVGKELYNQHCRSCHGNKGKGDGPKARNLKTFPGDFGTKEFQAQTDGEIYYQSFVGRDEMPNFEKKITDEQDRWAVVGFIRTLK